MQEVVGSTPTISTRSVLHIKGYIAGVAQLVEHQLPKLRVAGSSPVSRSKGSTRRIALLLYPHSSFCLPRSLGICVLQMRFSNPGESRGDSQCPPRANEQSNDAERGLLWGTFDWKREQLNSDFANRTC